MSKNGTGWHFKKILLSDGWAEDVSVNVGEDGQISAITRDSNAGEAVSGIAIPALSNVHSHAFQRALVGLTEQRGPSGDNFWSWRKVMYRLLKTFGPEDLEAIAAQAYVEMLKAGYAGVAEFHYLHHQADGTPYGNRAETSEAIIRAAKRTGIDLLMLPVLYQRAGFGRDDVEEGQRPFYNSFEAFQALMEQLRGKCRLGVAPHSLRAVHEGNLEEAVHLCDGPVHIHISEQTKEVNDCQKAHGKRPVEWLLDNLDVDARWNLIHATHMTGAETELLAKSGATVVLCPTSEGNLGDGFFSFADYIRAGGRFAIGSDSHVSIDPREELRLLEYGQRLTYMRRAIAGKNPGAALWQGALSGGASAMGYEKSGLQVGAPAHIVVLDDSAASLAGKQGDNILDTLVFAGHPNPVKDVMVSGNWRVTNFHHPREETILENYLKAVSSL